jgi:hypothetical protein
MLHHMSREREERRKSGRLAGSAGIVGPVPQAVFLAYKPAVADLLCEKNTVPRLISRADKLSRTGAVSGTREREQR